MKKEHYILLFIFLLALSLRLFFTLQTPYFSSDESYLNLRLTEHITSNGTPLVYDDLSYSGRTLAYSPLFHYILALFDLTFPIIIIAKILVNLFASSLVIVVYLISKQLTKNKNISLMTSFISAFIPIYLTSTTNTINIYSLIIPLIFYSIYCLMNIERMKYPYIFTIMFISLLHPSSLLLIIGFIFYIVIMKLSNIKQKPAELEAILFATLVTVWSIFLIFKKAFLVHGLSVIWQNIPSQVLRYYFTNINVFDLLYKIGIIPLLCGIYIIFIYTYKEKNKNINLLIGLASSTFLLIWLHLLRLETGIIFLGIILTILFSQFMKNLLSYISKTKISHLKPLFSIIVFLVFIPTLVIPSLTFTKDSLTLTPLDEDVKAMIWLRQNTDPNSTILTNLYNGHLLTYFSERKNMADSYFLLISNINERVDDIRKIYTTHYETDAIQLLNKYDIDYILFSSQERSTFNLDKIRYVNDKRCFELVYDEEAQIYRSLCKLIER